MIATEEFEDINDAVKASRAWELEMEGNYWNIVFLKTGGWDGS